MLHLSTITVDNVGQGRGGENFPKSFPMFQFWLNDNSSHLLNDKSEMER